jgi:hypothetical protein
MFVMGCNGKKMEEREQWSNGQGRRRNGRDTRSRRRMQNQGRGGAGMSMGSLVFIDIGRNLLMERGGRRLGEADKMFCGANTAAIWNLSMVW